MKQPAPALNDVLYNTHRHHTACPVFQSRGWHWDLHFGQGSQTWWIWLRLNLIPHDPIINKTLYIWSQVSVNPPLKYGFWGVFHIRGMGFLSYKSHSPSFDPLESNTYTASATSQKHGNKRC